MTFAPLAVLLTGENAPLALSLRLAATAIAAVLFYRALGAPGKGWGRARPEIVRRAVFTLLGALIFFQTSASFVPQASHPGGGGKAFQAYTQGVIGLRNRFLQDRLRIPDQGGTAVDAVAKLSQAVEHAPQNVHYRRTLGISQAEKGEYTAALQTLRKATDVLAERDPDRARVERHFWDELYGPKPPTPERLEEAVETAERFGFGWAGRVAVLSAWRRIDDHPAPRDLQRQLEVEAENWFQTLTSGAIGALFLVPQLGLVVICVTFVLIRQGVLKGVSPESSPIGFVLWEGFILMLVSGNAIGWLGLPRLSAESAPGAIALRIVAVDLIQIGALVYLWYRLKQHGCTLAEIGLTRKAFRANLAIGLASAVVFIPAAFVISLVTATLSERFFPQAPPAYHPLAGWTATSGIEIRLALFSAAVIGAPLLEEIFFRGALFGALRRRFGVAAGILVSSTVFAVLHPQLPLGFLPIAVLGAAFAALYAWRNSLVPGIVAHAANNGLAFLLLNLYFPRDT